MTPARQALIDAAKRIAAEEGGGGLIGFAVDDVMKGLIEHWEDALKDQSVPPDIVSTDMDELIWALVVIRDRLKRALPNTLERLAEI